MRKGILSIVVLSILLLIAPSGAWAQKKKNNKPKAANSKEQENKAEFLFIKAEGHYLLQEYDKAIALFQEALSLSPNNATIHFKISESYFYGGILTKAIEHGKKAVELNAERKEFYLLLADEYLSNMQFEESAQVYEKMLANVKDTQEYQLDLAELYNELVKIEKGKKDIYKQHDISGTGREKEINKTVELYTQKALNAYNEAEKHFGVHEEITFKKQRLYLGENKVDEAIKEGEKLIEAYPDELRYYLNQAELIYSNNRQENAIAFLENLIKKMPDEPAPLLMLSDFYKGIGNTTKSDESIEKAFNNPKMDVDAKVKMISTYLQYMHDENKKQTALKLASKIVETHPDKPQAHSVYGDVLFLTGDKKQARDEYYKAAQLDPTKILIWQQIVGLDAEFNDKDLLLYHSDEALKYFPEKALLWLYNGLGHQMKKNKQEAVNAYENGLKLAKGDAQLESQFQAQLGDAYNEINEYEKSDAAYEKALEYDPNNVHVLNNFSYFLSLRKDKLDQAKAMAGRVIRMNPDEATYLDTYAWVLYMMNDFDGAKKYLERALKTSNDGTIIEHYGDVLFKLGLREEALLQWKKAKEQGGTSDLIDKKIQDKKLYE